MTYLPNNGFTAEMVLASTVADDGTVAISYPSGSSQLSFTAGLAKYGSSYILLNDNKKWLEGDDPANGKGVEFTFGASTVTITNRSGVSWTAGTKLRVNLDQVDGTFRIPLTLPVSLDTVTAADVVTEMRPGIDGYIEHMEWVTDVAPSAGDAATFNLEIDTTNVTGGTIVLDSAAAGVKGTVVAATRITANNRITKTSKLSVEASDVTDYASGSGSLIVYIRPDLL